MGHNKYLSEAVKKRIVQASNNDKTATNFNRYEHSMINSWLYIKSFSTTESLPSFNKVRTPEINNFLPR